MIMQSGWVKIHRQMLEWGWYDDLPTKCLFLHLLLKANYEPKEWHGIKIERGQILTSLNTLADETGLTKQQVRTALTHLISTHEITQDITHHYTIVTICKYDSYQGEEFESNTQSNTQINTQLTQDQHSANTALTLTKEYKEYKEYKKKEFIYKEKNTKKENKKELDQKFRCALIEIGVSESLVDEWLYIRKEKKAGINTAEAFKRFIKQTELAGLTPAEAVNWCCENQFAGFKADWYFKNKNQVRKTQGAGVGVGVSSNGIYTKEQWQAITEAGERIGEMLGMRTK